MRLHTGIDVQGRYGVSATDTAFLYNAGGFLTSTLATASMVSARRLATGVFGEAEIPLAPWLRVSGGVRGERSRSRSEGGFFGDRTVGHEDVAATGALVFAPSADVTVVAQVARGFREPTLTDRFSRGPVGRGFLEGSPDLGPETSRQLDLTARFSRGRVAVGGAWYRYDIRRLIERYLAGPDLFRMRNRGHARLEGAELEVRLVVAGGLTIEVLAQAARGRDADDGTALDDIAPRSASLILRRGWRDRLSSYLRVAAVAAHRKAGPSEVATPGYTLVDAAVSWRLRRGLDVTLTTRNLLDAARYASAGPRWVWAPGRQAVLAVVAAR